MVSLVICPRSEIPGNWTDEANLFGLIIWKPDLLAEDGQHQGVPRRDADLGRCKGA